jgi:hypothetical protein
MEDAPGARLRQSDFVSRTHVLRLRSHKEGCFMKTTWKKQVVITLVAMLVAGLFGLIQYAGAQMEGLGAARAANQRAATLLQQTMTQMDSVSNMPLTGNEKAMMGVLHQMGSTVKMLVEVNTDLIHVIEHDRK